jgi:hypothetical protein
LVNGVNDTTHHAGVSGNIDTAYPLISGVIETPYKRSPVTLVLLPIGDS